MSSECREALCPNLPLSSADGAPLVSDMPATKSLFEHFHHDRH
jgi:hypothetical protein